MADFKELLTGFKEQLVEASKLGTGLKFWGVKKVLVCGMGGSALPGDFIKSLFYPLSFELVVNKDYVVPDYINKDYLCFCVSYSGNTEETLAAYKELVKRRCRIVVVTSGGKLAGLAKKDKNNLVIVPSGFPPRMAIAYQTLPIINVLSNSGIVKFDLSAEVLKAKSVFDFDFERNAKIMAKILKGSVPIIYSSANNLIAAEKWKISFNENSKAPAFYNFFPEWNHNEINSFENAHCRMTVVMLNDEHDEPSIKNRFKVCSDILTSKGIKVVNLKLEGKSKFSRLFFAIIYGDWVSYELANFYNQDPLSVPIVEELKKKLESFKRS